MVTTSELLVALSWPVTVLANLSLYEPLWLKLSFFCCTAASRQFLTPQQRAPCAAAGAAAAAAVTTTTGGQEVAGVEVEVVVAAAS